MFEKAQQSKGLVVRKSKGISLVVQSASTVNTFQYAERNLEPPFFLQQLLIQNKASVHVSSFFKEII